MNFHCARLFVFVMIHVVALGTLGRAQQFQDTFYDQWERQDTLGMLGFLDQWKKAEPYNPDVYVGFFNYYAIQTFEEQVILQSEVPQDGSEYLEIKDSLGNVSGYLCSTMAINDSILDIAFGWVDKGIVKFPDRLDLRMGKVYLAIETDRMGQVQEGLMSAIAFGDSIQYQWKWMREEVLDSGQFFLYSSVQGHLLSLFEKQDSVSDDVIMKVSEWMVNLDPRQFMAMTNIATVYMIREDYLQAMNWLKKADKVHANDAIILSNMGYCSMRERDWKRARRFYQEAMKWSDEEGKIECQKQLDEIDVLSREQ